MKMAFREGQQRPSCGDGCAVLLRHDPTPWPLHRHDSPSSAIVLSSDDDDDDDVVEEEMIDVLSESEDVEDVKLEAKIEFTDVTPPTDVPNVEKQENDVLRNDENTNFARPMVESSLNPFSEASHRKRRDALPFQTTNEDTSLKIETDHDTSRNYEALQDVKTERTMLVPGRKATADEKCAMCGLVNWKYRCPNCQRTTCSLPCIRRHTEIFQCDGKKSLFDKKVRVLADYTEDTFFSDYFFMERVALSCESASRLLSQHFSDHRRRDSFSRRPPASVLRRAARERGVRLRTCPVEATIRKVNTSCLASTSSSRKAKTAAQWAAAAIEGDSGNRSSNSARPSSGVDCDAIDCSNSTLPAGITTTAVGGDRLSSRVSVTTLCRLKWRIEWRFAFIPSFVSVVAENGSATTPHKSTGGATRQHVTAGMTSAENRCPVFIDVRIGDNRNLGELVQRFWDKQLLPYGVRESDFTDAIQRNLVSPKCCGDLDLGRQDDCPNLVVSRVSETERNSDVVEIRQSNDCDATNEMTCRPYDLETAEKPFDTHKQISKIHSDVAADEMKGTLQNESQESNTVDASIAGPHTKTVSTDEGNDCSRNNWAVLLRKFGTPANSQQHYLLDQTKTVAENLMGKTIIEFPLFIVIYQNYLQNYRIAANDDVDAVYLRGPPPAEC